MTAKEMFEQLHYKIEKNNKNELIYRYDEVLMEERIIQHIMFAKISKIIFSYREQFGEFCGIGMAELQAINKQVDELGWNK